MQKQTFSSMGVDAEFNVPSTVEEFDALAKKPGACLREAVLNVVYRGALADFREAFIYGIDADPEKGVKPVKGLVAITNIPVKTRVVLKDGKPVMKDGQEVTEPDESENDYFKRVCAQTGKKPEDYQSVANSIAAAIVFDPSQTERKPKAPAKVPDDIMEKATTIVKNGNFQKLVDKLSKDLAKAEPAIVAPVATGTLETDAKAIGSYMYAHYRYKTAELRKKQMETAYAV